VAAVALNNLVCIFLFELARLTCHELLGASSQGAFDLIVGALFQLLNAALVGALAALGMAAVARFVPQVEKLATAGFITLLLTAGLASYLGYSSLMACMFLGLTQTNVLRRRDKVVDTVFGHFEPAILTVFFTLAGMELTLEHAGVAGLLALVFFTCRAFGKITAGHVAMRLAGATDALRRNLGMALVP
jgi:Kef-type K+ transport system membrane component KefB